MEMATKKSKKAITNSPCIYPFPDKVDQWKQSLQYAFEKEFITEAEVANCIEQGCMTIALLAQIHARIVTHCSYNMILIMTFWLKIKNNLDWSEDAWISHTINPV